MGARSGDQNWNKRRAAGKMVNDRRAWATLPKFDLILFVGDDLSNPEINKDSKYDYPHSPVYFDIRYPAKRNPTRISLTGMTTAELDVFEKFILHAISRARPIVEDLDRMAWEAFENGDDSYERLYRPDPQFIDREGGDLPVIANRKRSVSEHNQSIQGRPEGSDQEYDNSNSELEQNDAGDSGGNASDSN